MPYIFYVSHTLFFIDSDSSSGSSSSSCSCSCSCSSSCRVGGHLFVVHSEVVVVVRVVVVSSTVG